MHAAKRAYSTSNESGVRTPSHTLARTTHGRANAEPARNSKAHNDEQDRASPGHCLGSSSVPGAPQLGMFLWRGLTAQEIADQNIGNEGDRTAARSFSLLLLMGCSFCPGDFA